MDNPEHPRDVLLASADDLPNLTDLLATHLARLAIKNLR